MKHTSFLQVGFLGVLMVLLASCSVPLGASSNSYEESPGRSDRYYGNGYYSSPNTIIVERDPFTGRYYEVRPGFYGNRIGRPAYPYGNRVYRNNNRNYSPRGGVVRRNNVAPTRPNENPVRQEQKVRERAQAKDAILGPKRN